MFQKQQSVIAESIYVSFLQEVIQSEQAQANDIPIRMPSHAAWSLIEARSIFNLLATVTHPSSASIWTETMNSLSTLTGSSIDYTPESCHKCL